MSRKRRLRKHRRSHRGQLPPANPAAGQQFNSSDPHVEHCHRSIAPDSEPREPRPQPDATDHVTDSSQLNRRESKLDATAKARLCDLVSVGKTIAQAARIVGVSERAVYYAKQRDPQFEQQLHESYEDPTLVCMQSMKRFAPEDRKAAMDYWKALEPERFDPRAKARAEKLAQKMTAEIRRGLSTIMTEEQLRQFDELLNPNRSQHKRRQNP